MMLSETDKLFATTSGPRDARIMLVGEAFGTDEAIQRRPFVGMSGQELTRILRDASLDREAILLTNVISEQPPQNLFDHFLEETPASRSAAAASLLRGLHPGEVLRTALRRLYELIRTVRPQLLIATGNVPLWALTDVTSTTAGSLPRRKLPSGIGNYRGSQLFTCPAVTTAIGYECPVLPIFHPAGILRNWEDRSITVHDLKKRVPLALAARWAAPSLDITIAPRFELTREYLTARLLRAKHEPVTVANDIETRQRLITCVGFTDDGRSALVLPFMNRSNEGNFYSFYTRDEEVTLTRLLRELYSHPNISFIGQNYFYDMYYLNHYYGVTPRLAYDTMGLQHLLFPGTQKDLGYLSSVYCEHHRYWKDDNKEWEARSGIDALETHWRYNGEDVLRTWEIAAAQLSVLRTVKRDHLWSTELRKHRLAFTMSTRGIRTDRAARTALSSELTAAERTRIERLLAILPQRLVDEGLGKRQAVNWPTSATQQKWVFYEFFGLSPQRHRKTKAITLDKEAIPKIRRIAPHLALLCDLLLELRSLSVFRSTFIDTEIDDDGRYRTSFNPFGPETFRWSSSANPLGRGGNLQNIPSGKEL